MKLTERINVLIQAITLSQKSGILNLDDAVKAKSAIDIITSGVINQNFTLALNALIEIAVLSQKKGAYSLKDAHMIYLAIEGIEVELQNEVNKINNEEIRLKETQKQTVVKNTIPQVPQQVQQEKQKNPEIKTSGETIVSIPPITLNRV
jgi:hypothetical protein